MKKRVVAVALIAVLVCLLFLLYRYNYIPHKKYSDDHFGVDRYKSAVDRDLDGVDDQTDILSSAYEYLDTKPVYKSRYYDGAGYPTDNFGVCTDVVAFALKGAGYDLMELVDADVSRNKDEYGIEVPDKYIDFRRVENLKVYFDRKAIPLSTDADDTDCFKAGDIVVFENHIGIISEHRNHRGVPFVLHHASIIQASYEEDILTTWGEIVGHYRIS